MLPKDDFQTAAPPPDLESQFSTEISLGVSRPDSDTTDGRTPAPFATSGLKLFRRPEADLGRRDSRRRLWSHIVGQVGPPPTSLCLYKAKAQLRERASSKECWSWS